MGSSLLGGRTLSFILLVLISFSSASASVKTVKLVPHCREILMRTAALRGVNVDVKDPELWAVSGEILTKFLDDSYPEEEGVRFYPRSGRVNDKEYSKPYLRLVSDGIKVPRSLGDLIEKAADQFQEQMNTLEAEVAGLSSQMGGDFLPESQRLVLEVMRQVVNASRVKAGANYLLGPILYFVNDTIRRFLRLLSASFKVDRDQADLLTLFIQMIEEGAVSLDHPEFRNVRDDLSVCALRGGTHPVSEATYRTLTLWAKNPEQFRFRDYLNGQWRRSARLRQAHWETTQDKAKMTAFRNKLRDTLARLQTNEAQLAEERRAFGIKHFAYLMLSDFLRQTVQSDGKQAIELNSLMVAVVQQSLEDFPSLREFFLSLFTNEGTSSFLHPATQRQVTFAQGLQEGLKSLGSDEIDPFLVNEILSPDRLRLEYFRAITLTLDYERSQMVDRLNARKAREAALRNEAHWEKIGQATFQSAMRSGGAMGLPNAAIQEIWQMLFEIDSQTSPLAAQTKSQLMTFVPVPVGRYFEILLNGAELQPAKDYLLKNETALHALDSATTTQAARTFDAAHASNFLKLYFRGLTSEAMRIFSADMDLQNKAFDGQRVDIAVEELTPLDEARRNVLEQVWQAFHALRECLIHHGNANQGMTEGAAHEVAMEILIRYLEENPTLERLVINTPYPKLNEVSGELVLRAFRARFGLKRNIVDSATDALNPSVQSLEEVTRKAKRRTWKLCIASAIVTLVTSSVGQHFKGPIIAGIHEIFSRVGVVAPARFSSSIPTPVRELPVSSERL